MRREQRFYCAECARFKDRFGVERDDFESHFFCKVCGSPVMKLQKVWKALLLDYIGYLVEKGRTDDFI